MGILRFFRDLFGSRQPCDLCQVGREEWPAERSVATNWSVFGHGLDVTFEICQPCAELLQRYNLQYQHPLKTWVQLEMIGHLTEPPQGLTDAFARHPTWREVFVHTADLTDDADLKREALEEAVAEYIRGEDGSENRSC